jgi:hypothetical protein
MLDKHILTKKKLKRKNIFFDFYNYYKNQNGFLKKIQLIALFL